MFVTTKKSDDIQADNYVLSKARTESKASCNELLDTLNSLDIDSRSGNTGKITTQDDRFVEASEINNIISNDLATITKRVEEMKEKVETLCTGNDQTHNLEQKIDAINHEVSSLDSISRNRLHMS